MARLTGVSGCGSLDRAEAEAERTAMSAGSLTVTAGLAALCFVGAALSATAQTRTPTGDGPSFSPPRAHPRIEVNPRPLLYRRCADWYVVQYRPSGTVLFPEKHCWWVRG